VSTVLPPSHWPPKLTVPPSAPPEELLVEAPPSTAPDELLVDAAPDELLVDAAPDEVELVDAAPDEVELVVAPPPLPLDEEPVVAVPLDEAVPPPFALVPPAPPFPDPLLVPALVNPPVPPARPLPPLLLQAAATRTVKLATP
jgi:hypothetical protein